MAEVERKRDKGWILLVFLALKPIYIWDSGGLQICDLFLAAASISLLVASRGSFRIPRKAIHTVVLFLVLCFYQVMVNLIWSAPTRMTLSKNSLYYIFNFVAFFVVLVIGYEIGVRALKRSLAIGTVIALSITAFGLLFVNSGSRALGFFNNPNQLGYFAVLAFSFIILCEEQISKGLFYGMLVLATWETIASGSKAAVIALFVMYALYVFYANRQHSARRLIGQMLLVLVLGLGLYVLLYSDFSVITGNHTVAFVRRRLLRMSQENDSALGSGRGYDRIRELGVHVLWGVGEGAYDRFTVMQGKESHSSYVTLLVSYGLIGAVGYFVFFLQCVWHRGQRMKNLFLISGVLLYGVTHNGLRNTLLWMLLAVLLLEGVEQPQQQVSNQGRFEMSRSFPKPGNPW